MEHLQVDGSAEICIVTLNRGKVNALNDLTVRELTECFRQLAKDESVRGIVLTGAGRFFSFGFDIPEFLSFGKPAFIEYLRTFTNFYAEIFLCPKPVVAAINGHAIAGGCMITTACDLRIMASGKGKISLNEITFGASVFSGCVEMLKHLVGGSNAQKILYSGQMYTPEEARCLGLVDDVASLQDLVPRAVEEAGRLAGRDAAAFASIKRLVRGPIADQIHQREEESIRRFADIWYSETTWNQLKEIVIRA